MISKLLWSNAENCLSTKLPHLSAAASNPLLQPTVKPTSQQIIASNAMGITTNKLLQQFASESFNAKSTSRNTRHTSRAIQ